MVDVLMDGRGPNATCGMTDAESDRSSGRQRVPNGVYREVPKRVQEGGSSTGAIGSTEDQ